MAIASCKRPSLSTPRFCLHQFCTAWTQNYTPLSCIGPTTRLCTKKILVYEHGEVGAGGCIMCTLCNVGRCALFDSWLTEIHTYTHLIIFFFLLTEPFIFYLSILGDVCVSVSL